MAVTASKCRLTFQAACLPSFSHARERGAGRGSGREIYNLIISSPIIAARDLLVSEALCFSLILSWVLTHAPDCKVCERNRDPEPSPVRFVHQGFVSASTAVYH